MEELKPNKSYHLEWQIKTDDVGSKLLKGLLKIKIDNVIYKIPVKINESFVEVDIPPLLNIVKKISNNRIICKLEVSGDGFYMNPWIEEYKIKPFTASNVVLTKLKENNQSFRSNNISREENVIRKNSRLERKFPSDAGMDLETYTKKLHEIISRRDKEADIRSENELKLAEARYPTKYNNNMNNSNNISNTNVSTTNNNKGAYSIQSFVNSKTKNEKVKEALLKRVQEITPNKEDQYDSLRALLNIQ